MRKSLNLVTGIILFMVFHLSPIFLLVAYDGTPSLADNENKQKFFAEVSRGPDVSRGQFFQKAPPPNRESAPRTRRRQGEYLGQEEPGQTAKVFAPGVVSLENRVEFGCTFSPDGKEFYFSIEKPDKRLVIMVMKEENNRWTQPQAAAFSGKYDDLEVSISPGGKRLFFSSNRPLYGNGESKKDFDIWYVEKSGKGWGKPQHAGYNVNTDGYEWYPTASLTGTLYFCGGKTPGLYRSKLIDGKYTTPEKIGDLFKSDIIGGHPYIAPDESYIITSAKEAPGGKGGWDLYISFQKADGSWTKSKNLGDKINIKENEDFPNVSPDGKYLFFTRLSRDSQGKEIGDIYWIDFVALGTMPIFKK